VGCTNSQWLSSTSLECTPVQTSGRNLPVSIEVHGVLNITHTTASSPIGLDFWPPSSRLLLRVSKDQTAAQWDSWENREGFRRSMQRLLGLVHTDQVFIVDVMTGSVIVDWRILGSSEQPLAHVEKEAELLLAAQDGRLAKAIPAAEGVGVGGLKVANNLTFDVAPKSNGDDSSGWLDGDEEIVLFVFIGLVLCCLCTVPCIAYWKFNCASCSAFMCPHKPTSKAGISSRFGPCSCCPLRQDVPCCPLRQDVPPDAPVTTRAPQPQRMDAVPHLPVQQAPGMPTAMPHLPHPVPTGDLPHLISDSQPDTPGQAVPPGTPSALVADRNLLRTSSLGDGTAVTAGIEYGGNARDKIIAERRAAKVPVAVPCSWQ